jgi:sarcosine oxidase subunit alpha
MAKKPPRKLTNPVRITFDGETITAERGEPLAAALVAAGKLSIARSPKFHRPRGPACFRAACDGCLARVDGVPNVMTCQVPAEEGSAIESQNKLGARELDLLRMTDWFFPDGMNHHELFAGVPGVQRVMQVFARRVAGLGKLPSKELAARKASRRHVEALVVGAGPSGMACALALRARGKVVEIVDDGLEAGGASLALPEHLFAAITAPFARAAASGEVTLRLRTTVAGIYGEDALVIGPGGAEVIEADTVVLAPGAHDGVLAFEGNDLPGVMSARAAGWLLRRGIVPGRHVVLCVSEDGGPFGEAWARAVADAKLPCEVTLLHGAPRRARGIARVKEVAIAEGDTERVLSADLLLVDAARSPAYELAEQAGAKLRHEPRGFVVESDGGHVRGRFWVAGEAAGGHFRAEALRLEAERLASRV